jgi:hypothetical protein
MHHAISSLVTASLALHMLLGCCWHHAHAEAAECAEISADHDHDEHSPVDHDHSKSCDGEGCVFVKCEQTSAQVFASAVTFTAIPQPVAMTLSLGNSTAPSPRLLIPLECSAHFMCSMLRC